MILEDKQENDKKFSKKLLSLMVQVFDDKVDDDAQEFFSKESQNHLGKNNFLIQNLIIASSSAVREEALRII